MTLDNESRDGTIITALFIYKLRKWGIIIWQIPSWEILQIPIVPIAAKKAALINIGVHSLLTDEYSV
jgi:hypothetical protein